HRAGVAEHDALVAVGGDDVPRRGAAAADDVAAGLLADPDARGAVAQGGVAGDGGADVVALDGVAERAGVEAGDAAQGVAGDDVAGPGGGAADRVVAGPVGDQNSVFQIRDGAEAGAVGADGVALHGVEARAGVREHDALVPVAGDDVALPDEVQADAVEAGP